MITGLDTNGKVYVSLVQANSNTSMMELFFKSLIQKLDAQDAAWRTKTVIMLDNAPYHSSKEMMANYEKMRIPIIFTGPHSYVSLSFDIIWCSSTSTHFSSYQLDSILLYLPLTNQIHLYRPPVRWRPSSLTSREQISIRHSCPLESRISAT